MSTHVLAYPGFERAVRVVLKHEGKLVDHASDPGGVTNYGISLRWAINQHIRAGDEALKLLDINEDSTIDAEDIRDLTEEAAKELYRVFFWEPNGYRHLRHQAVQTKILDMAVNMGPRQAHKLAQRAVRAAGDGEIEDDGILGPISFQHINVLPADTYLASVRSEQAGFYRALVIRNNALRERGFEVPNFADFLTGWLRRAYA